MGGDTEAEGLKGFSRVSGAALLSATPTTYGLFKLYVTQGIYYLGAVLPRCQCKLQVRFWVL
jgi:hypothetical protein